jgi:hypothetical protein
VPSESIAPFTVRLIVGAEAAASLAAFCESVNPPPATLASDAPETADLTPLDDVVVDPVPVEAITLGTEIVGILDAETLVLGSVTVGTLIDGAEICETLGKNGIEL